jgi:hypothetical protein
MANYTKHDYHKDWAKAKKAANLPDKLFKKGLGAKLETMNKLHADLMKASPKTAKVVHQKVSKAALEISAIVKDYTAIVNANGKDDHAISVLARIGGGAKNDSMLFNIALDQGAIYQRYKSSF